MTLPANVRTNWSAPFPSKVKGSSIVTVAKQNGIWTIGISLAVLSQLPTGSNPTQIEIPVWNSVTNIWQFTTVASLQSGALAATVVTHAMSPYAVLPTDYFLLVDTTGGAIEIDLPLSANRGGISLSIKDYKGDAATNNITIKPQGAPANEGLDGYTNAAPLVLSSNYDGVRILPITGGYTIAP